MRQEKYKQLLEASKAICKNAHIIPDAVRIPRIAIDLEVLLNLRLAVENFMGQRLNGDALDTYDANQNSKHVGRK